MVQGAKQLFFIVIGQQFQFLPVIELEKGFVQIF